MEGLQHFRSQELLKLGLFWEVLREGFRDFDGSGGFWGSWSFGDFGGSWGHGVEGYVFFGIKKLIYINISTFTSVLPASSVVRRRRPVASRHVTSRLQFHAPRVLH